MDKLDKYQIIKHVGSGAFGDVYQCYDPYLQREVAVKVIKVPNPIKFVQAVKEGQALEHCRHTHTVDVKDVRATTFNKEFVVIIIMEYLAKGSIQGKIEKRFISIKESCRIINQSLLGLEHAHNNNMLHRDIKPGNIMIGDNDEIKLSDFGLAINYHEEPSTITGYRPHQPLEVIEGNPMSKLSDIYAMGITFYRLLNNTNKLDFNFVNHEEWRKAVKSNKFPPRNFSPHVPTKLIRVLNKSIHNDKEKRYQTCGEFRQAIDRLRFFIDWNQVDDDTWVGVNNEDHYEIEKLRNRNGWIINFKKNGIRRTERCYKNLPDQLVDKEFFDNIRQTTLI